MPFVHLGRAFKSWIFSENCQSKPLTFNQDSSKAAWGLSGFHKMHIDEPLEFLPFESQTFCYIWGTSDVQ